VAGNYSGNAARDEMTAKPSACLAAEDKIVGTGQQTPSEKSARISSAIEKFN